MSYGVALRNGVPFTLGTIAALCVNATTQWNPLSLWPDGILSPGMWISPRDLTSEWQDYTGTTPVAVPGTVADSSNPVGLALDIRAGAPDVLGPELVVNGDFSNGTTGWTGWPIVDGKAVFDGVHGDLGQAIVPLTVGAFYQVSWYQSGASVYVRLGGSGNLGSQSGPGQKTMIFSSPGAAGLVLAQAGMTPNVDYIDNISVREVPGNHMLQSTSAARPLASARVNLLNYTEDFSNAAWRNFDNGLDFTYDQIDPTGNNTAVLLVPKSVDGWHGIDYYGPNYSITGRTARVLVKPAGLRYFYLTSGALQVSEMNLYAACFDLTGEGTVIRLGLYNSSATITLDPSGYYICEAVAVDEGLARICFAASNSSTFSTFTGDGTSGFYFAWPDLRAGSAADNLPSYQSVPGDGSTYATDFPIFQKYDGTDDGMATAAFPAGTLIDGMDCQIAVRRDSAAACVAGLYNGIADATKFFGMAESASGSGCVGSGAGTPTVWVDNAQLTGGTAVTRGTLHTALTVGDYHILEFRGLDLSTWTAAGFGLYTSYVFPGARGDILLYPSTASTEDKDAARQYLADYYGVTLP